MTETRGGVLTWGWVAVVLKHGLVSGLACWALWVQMVYRVPSQLLFVLLPWAGAATTALSLVLLINHVLDTVGPPGPVRQTLRRLEWSASMVVRVFIYYSLLLFANAKLDAGKTTDRPSEVRAIRAVRPVLGGLAPYGWITLRSREDGARSVRLVLRPDERDRFWVGEAVVVEQRAGRLRIPWIAGIVADRERQSRAILEVVPEAAQAWKDLVDYYRERGRYAEAADAALRYLAIYPGDWLFAIQLADHFDVAEQPGEGVRILEPLTQQAPRASVAKSYGLALARSGRKADGAHWLEESVRLDPADFWGHYHLGNTLRDLGRVNQAISVYERALALKPGFPEIEVELGLLRKAVLRKPA
jgi:tetratricopeptide (TPR) repeat protein